MRVKMLRNVSREWGVDVREGKSGEVEDKLGEQLVQRGLAEKLEESPKPTRRRRQKSEAIQAVPEPASIEGDDTPDDK